jgi:hypothetical protein
MKKIENQKMEMANSLTIILTFCAVCTMTNCYVPEVKFLEPQPINKKNLSSFPRSYQGKYLAISDSSILTISSKLIYQEWNGFAKVSTTEMNEELDTIYENNVEIQLGDNWVMNIEIDGDSASIIIFGIDTIFTISGNNFLRSFKGYLFLNSLQIDSTWRIKTLKLDNKKLDFSDLVNPNQIDSLREITKILTDLDSASNRINYHKLNPKKKELKEILKRKEKETRFRKL